MTEESFHEPDAPAIRNSRHIPHREAMDMEMASFHLSDDSFSMWDSPAEEVAEPKNVAYREALAEHLGAKMKGPILRFRTDQQMNSTNPSIQVAGGGKRGQSRIISSNPERVLDAPEIPTFPTQVLDWGANNILTIGLKNVVYTWDVATATAKDVIHLQDHMRVHWISWLSAKCNHMVITIQDGTTYLFSVDGGQQKFLRALVPPTGAGISCMSISGPIIAAGSSQRDGRIFIFDIRTKDALVQTYEAHSKKVTCLSYSTKEPYYLASGSADGCVKIWDARKTSAPRYAFSKVHDSVAAICWNPDKRSFLFSGGTSDRMLRSLNTHGAPIKEEDCSSPMSRLPVAPAFEQSVATGSPIVSILATHGTGEVLTAQAAGILQLRKSSTFQLLGTFSAPNCTESFISATLGPDRETVCAAQRDDTLKFWKCFDLKQCKRKREKDDSLLDVPLR